MPGTWIGSHLSAAHAHANNHFSPATSHAHLPVHPYAAVGSRPHITPASFIRRATRAERSPRQSACENPRSDVSPRCTPSPARTQQELWSARRRFSSWPAIVVLACDPSHPLAARSKASRGQVLVQQWEPGNRRPIDRRTTASICAAGQWKSWKTPARSLTARMHSDSCDSWHVHNRSNQATGEACHSIPHACNESARRIVGCHAWHHHLGRIVPSRSLSPLDSTKCPPHVSA